MQGAKDLPAHPQVVHLFRDPDRLRVEFDHRVHPRTVLVQRKNAVEVILGELFRSDRPCRHLRLEIGNGSFVEMRWSGRHRI